MSSRNIAIIVTDYGSYLNFLQEFSSQLSKSPNRKVYVFSSAENLIRFNHEGETFKEVNFCQVDLPRSFQLLKIIRASIQIRNLIKSHKISLVHAHFTSAIFASVLFKVNRCKYWGTFHGLNFNIKYGFEKILFSVIEIFSIFRLDRTIVLNKYDFNYLKKFRFKNLYKTTSYGVGCDLEKFTLKMSPFFCGDRSNLIISFTGRFVSFKGFHMLIRAFRLLETSLDLKVKLKLIGDFDPERNSGLNHDEISYVNNNKNIQITGFVEDVQKELVECDVFVFLSRKEGLPVSLLEALVSGKLVIALNSRGVEDVIVNGVNGYLIDDNFDNVIVENVVNLILNLLRSPSEYEQLIKNIEQERFKYSRHLFVHEQIIWIEEFENN
jgi:glycosyltransferase involved in cell wall biosynthesis